MGWGSFLTALCSFGKDTYCFGDSLGLWRWEARDASGWVGNTIVLRSIGNLAAKRVWDFTHSSSHPLAGVQISTFGAGMMGIQCQDLTMFAST